MEHYSVRTAKSTNALMDQKTFLPQGKQEFKFISQRRPLVLVLTYQHFYS